MPLTMRKVFWHDFFGARTLLVVCLATLLLGGLGAFILEGITDRSYWGPKPLFRFEKEVTGSPLVCLDLDSDGTPELIIKDRDPDQTRVVVVEDREIAPVREYVREVPVAVPVYLTAPVRRSIDRRNIDRELPDRLEPAKRAEPVYWGFGGKLRPDAWKPAEPPKKESPKKKDKN